MKRNAAFIYLLIYQVINMKTEWNGPFTEECISSIYS